MVENVYDYCQPTLPIMTNTFTAKPGSSFFFPLGNLLVYNRKRERSWSTQGVSPRGSLRKGLV